MSKSMLSLYTSIMDSRVNPLRHLPPSQAFQLMVVLSMMWTAIFCASASAWLWYGELLIGHVLFAAGIIVTSLVFRAHQPRMAEGYRAHPKSDGTARYDDVWGG